MREVLIIAMTRASAGFYVTKLRFLYRIGRCDGTRYGAFTCCGINHLVLQCSYRQTNRLAKK